MSKKLNVYDLIDKYIPTKTKGEWLEMVGMYEERITDILIRLHRATEHINALSEHIVGLEDEYGRSYTSALSLGSVHADVIKRPEEMDQVLQICWRPDPYATHAVISPMTKPGEYPHILDATLNHFERATTKHLKDAAQGALVPVLGNMRKEVPRGLRW